MNFITAVDLLKFLGASELASIVSGKVNQSIDDEALVAVINGSDTASFQSGVLDNANLALMQINNIIETVSKLMSGYLPSQYSALSAIDIADSPLPLIAIKLSRYELSLNPSDFVMKEQQNALTQLRDIAKGIITLGQANVEPTSSGARVSIAQPSSLTQGFGR